MNISRKYIYGKNSYKIMNICFYTLVPEMNNTAYLNDC